MTPHHKETNLSNEPVRFYKIIALTFLVLTLVLLGVIVFMSAKRATITIVTKPEPVEVMAMLELKDNPTIGMLEKTAVNVTKTFKPASTREEESVAIGEVTLFNTTGASQALVATTRLITADGVLFRLKKGVVVPAKGKAVAEVYADKAGKASEIGPSKFTIPGLSEAKQKVVYAESEKPMAGGVKQFGVIGQEDIKEAENEMKAELKKQGEAQLAQLHSDLKAVYTTVDVVIKADKEVGVEADEFTLSGSAVVVGVFYNASEVENLIKQELQKKIVGDAETLSSSNNEPQVTLEEFDKDTGRAVLKVAGSGVVELNPESDQLQKIIFFGKTRDEIRRYLLSLDHVNGVEIKFSPAWMNTVPHVAEHVNVVVKKVE